MNNHEFIPVRIGIKLQDKNNNDIYYKEICLIVINLFISF